MTPRNFLIRGVIAGFIAGIVAFGVASLTGEPAVDAAIAVEEAASAPAADHHAGDEAVEPHSHGDEDDGGEITRGQQAGPGLATATIAIGTAFGGLLGVLAAFAVGRLGSLRPLASTATVVAIGFVSVALVPWIKYPPNPPATGSGDTIGERTGQYFGFVAISIVAAVVALLIARRLLDSTTAFNAVVAGAAVYLVLVIVAGLVMPSIDEVPDSFPANTLFSFRMGAIATQASLFATIGVVLAGLVGHLFAGEQSKRERRDLVGTAI